MSETVSNCARRGADVYHRHRTLQFVVSGFVEHIADSYHGNVFADEVYRQAGRAAAEHPRHGIQFLSPILQIGSGHDEIGCAESSAGRE